MKNEISGFALLVFSLCFGVIAATAQTDVTSPTDPIQIVNGTDDGDGDAGSPPPGEVVSYAIDNSTSKYLNFLDLNSGFIVTPNAGSTVVKSLRLYTANDFPGRDPASYRLEGSNNGGATWTQISAGALNLPAGRNASGQPITTPGLFFDTVSFTNTTFYTSYRLIFPTLKDAAGNNSMQIGEVEFLNAVPTAASVEIGGRVLSSSRGAVASARVFLTNQNGETRTALTNGAGYYRFTDVQAGEIYTISVRHKRYRFETRALSVTGEANDFNLVAVPR